MGLSWNTAGARSFYTVDREINSPEDLAGLKIRVPNSRSMTQAVEMLGATATPVPWGEVYTALQQGIVDGAEGSPTSLIDGKFVEVVRHFSFDRHFTIPDVLIISTKTWSKLSDEQEGHLQGRSGEIHPARCRTGGAEGFKSGRTGQEAGPLSSRKWIWNPSRPA